jgi:hypothetical protein
VKVVAVDRPRQFVALKDPATAGLHDVSNLYAQASTISSITYLLHGAAAPLVAGTMHPLQYGVVGVRMGAVRL